MNKEDKKYTITELRLLALKYESNPKNAAENYIGNNAIREFLNYIKNKK